MPVQEMFWGDRMGAVLDPFSYSWMIARRTREVQAGAKAAFAEMTPS